MPTNEMAAKAGVTSQMVESARMRSAAEGLCPCPRTLKASAPAMKAVSRPVIRKMTA